MSRLFACIAWLLFATLVHADERTFSVSFDGKAVGNFTITTKTLDGGTTEIRADIDVAGGDKAYSLSYRGTERWKSGRLVRLEGSGAENREKGSVTLHSGKDGYALKAGVKEVAVRGDVWPTTFWLKPDADRPLVVDATTGSVFHAKIEKIGPDRVTVADKPIVATHYRLSFDGRTVELWYDKADRLVRRKWSSAGHTVEMQLAGMKD